jgi:cytochrome c oxidase subunit 3
LSADAPVLARHFEDLEQQHEAASMGMWIFLGTELMVFGGLFTGYAVYRAVYPDAFAAGSRQLNVWFGGVNTVVLLTSSLTMALAVHAAQVGRRQSLVAYLAVTALLGTAFLVIKGFEYHEDYQEKLVPDKLLPKELVPGFDENEWTAESPKKDRRPPEKLRETDPYEAEMFPRRVELFLMCYYIMTGLHALHLIIGITILAIQAVLAYRGWFPPAYYAPVEISGLYWHFVDIVWIFLLPLLYLIGGTH